MCQPWPLGADPQSRDARQQRFAHFTELAIISVQEIVDFAKQVPGFLQLGREDQIALLKASTIEVTIRLSELNVVHAGPNPCGVWSAGVSKGASQG